MNNHPRQDRHRSGPGEESIETAHTDSNEVTLLRQQIHTHGDFNKVPEQILERYIELMNERDSAEFREEWY